MKEWFCPSVYDYITLNEVNGYSIEACIWKFSFQTWSLQVGILKSLTTDFVTECCTGESLNKEHILSCEEVFGEYTHELRQIKISH